jgi:hypothetical protein
MKWTKLRSYAPHRTQRRMTFFRSLILFVPAATLLACKDSGPEPQPQGPPTEIVLVSGGGQEALAKQAVPAPITIVVRDENGNALPDQTVNLAIVSGGGILGGTSVTTGVDGTATLPTWTLGKSALPQTVRATLNALELDISASVQTDYNIVVRFFGTSMSSANRALFLSAAARLSGIVIGDITDAQADEGQYSSPCGVPNAPSSDEVIDDIIIYAAITAIDGAGGVLARSGPCLGRTTPMGFMSAVAVMEFDSADLASLSGGGSLEDVIIHEMLHALGFGVFWDELLVDAGGSNPRFTGAQARQGCVAVGGEAVCGNGVAVESRGGAGTADSHWRERTSPSFDNELMTGFINAGSNPLSKITIGSLADIGYEVNMDSYDEYAFGAAALRAPGPSLEFAEEWETIIRPQWILDPTGQARRITPR